MKLASTARISVTRGREHVPLVPLPERMPLASPPSQALRCETHRFGDLEIPEHEHAHLCLHLQTAGQPEMEWWWNGRNRVESPSPGALLLLPPGTRDRLRWQGGSERIIVTLEDEALRSAAESLRGSDPTTIATHWHLRDEGLRSLVAEIGREAAEGWPLGTLYSDLLSQSLSTRILLRHSAGVADLPAVRGGISPRALKASLEFISDNLHRDVRLAEIAAVAGLSPFHFARLFRQSTGSTPHQYQLEQRMRYAKQQLRAGMRPVAEIGIEAGFKSAAHFSRAFHAREGVPPSEWRQRL